MALIMCRRDTSNDEQGEITGQIDFQLPHLERLVTGSRITIHSFTSPYLQKYSFSPSEGGEKTATGSQEISNTKQLSTKTPKCQIILISGQIYFI